MNVEPRYVFFVNDSVGWIVGGGQVLKTNNSGDNWLIQNSNHKIYDLFFLNEDKGWTAGKDTVFYSTDGGVSWNVQFVNPRP